jgi:hypothetical protein
MRIERWEVVGLSVLLAVYLAVLVSLVHRTGITIDEPAHILSSILYWEGNDHLKPRDMPPMIKLVGGWAAADAGFRIVEESHPVWEQQHEWNIALDMTRRMGERRIWHAMPRARLPLLIFPLATALLLWWWGRQLFSPLAGLAAAALFMLEPTALGHGALYKNDHAATFGFLLFWFQAWRYWRRPAWDTGLALGVGLAAAVLAKLSMLVLIPIAVGIVIARWRPAGLLAFAVLWVLTLGACQWETRTFSGFLPLPAPMWDGAVALWGNTQGENSVYLLGRHWPHGHRAYFLIAALVKVPEILLVLVAGGIAWTAARAWNRKLQVADLFWIVPGALYFSAASMSSLQLGFRLVLPVLPFALLFAASLLDRISQTRWRYAIAIPFVLLLAANVWVYPHQLSHFNLASGGPRNGLRYLSDSNIDWGQDLRELRSWMHRNAVPHMRMSYLGADNLLAYFREDEFLWVDPPFSDAARKRGPIQPVPGLYAISANLITGQFFEPAYRDYYKAFREAKPIDYAGHSIYIFRFP